MPNTFAEAQKVENGNRNSNTYDGTAGPPGLHELPYHLANGIFKPEMSQPYFV